MRRRLLWLALLLAPVIAGAVDTPTNNKTFTYGLRLYLTDHYVNGDSGDVAAAYPASEDTAGKRQDLVWVGGAIQAWSFTPDSSEVYTIYARASCCSDTAISGLTSRYFQAADIPEGLINDSRAFAAGVVDSASLAAGAALRNLIASSGDSVINMTGNVIAFDSLKVKFDTLQAVFANITSALYVQAGVPPVGSSAIVQADDGVFAIRNVPLDADSAHFSLGVTMSDDLTLNGLLSAGVAPGQVHTINGTIDASNDLDAADDLIAGDDLTVGGDANLGNAVTDTVRVHGPLTFDREVRYLLAHCDTLYAYNSPDDIIEVDGVSELIAAGYYVHCVASWDWDLTALVTYGYGATYSGRTINAAPYSQTAATGDSVYVIASGNVADATQTGYCVRCWGTDFPVNTGPAP